MNIKKLVLILIIVMLISFSIGTFSLVNFDGLRMSRILPNIASGIDVVDSAKVKIGTDGIVVNEKKEHVVVSWDGISVSDGDEHVVVGWDGIDVKSGDERVRVGIDGVKVSDDNRNLSIKNFGFISRDLQQATLNDEKVESIDGINTIEISSSFVDIKVLSENRDDVKIKYHGTMIANIIPVLETHKSWNGLVIEVKSKDNVSYTVRESDAVLEVYIPESFNGNYNISSSSGEIYIEGLSGNDIIVDSSSGGIAIKSITGRVELETSSGEINASDIAGSIDTSASSGDINLAVSGVTGDVKIDTSSGDVYVTFSNDASFKVTGETSSGDIEHNSSFNNLIVEDDEFEFSVGDSSNSMTITTSSGDISFNR